MVGRALSERAKQQACRRIENSRMQEAIDEYLCEQAKTNRTKKRGYRLIAAAHDVDPSTLSCLVNGGTSMSTFNTTKRKLTIAEERVLVDFILKSADRATPLSPKRIETHANAILQGCAELVKPVGQQWVERFLQRYNKELQTH